jgi:hypothetical protein
MSSFGSHLGRMCCRPFSFLLVVGLLWLSGSVLLWSPRLEFVFLEICVYTSFVLYTMKKE